MDINERVQISILAKYYGSLLTEKQQKIIDMYVDNNLSLSEVGEELNISRQAVKDMLDKAEKLLNKYEEKLHFISKDDKIREIISKEETNEAVKKILLLLEEWCLYFLVWAKGLITFSAKWQSMANLQRLK